ncbi:MAG TPA: hypothetical protein VD866_32250 [Urbifossiella sp.]|nr:hypothetical protein [Urbifossiella sp.]
MDRPTPTPLAVPPAVWPHAPAGLTPHQVSGGYWQVRDARGVIVATVFSSNPAAAQNVVAAVLDYARCRAAAEWVSDTSPMPEAVELHRLADDGHPAGAELGGEA